MEIDFHETLSKFEEQLLEEAAAVDVGLACPLYVVNRPLAGARSATFPGADRAFQKEIAESGKWNGRGKCVILDLDAFYFRPLAQGRDLGMDERQADRHARLTLAGGLVHELAHSLVAHDPKDEEALLARAWTLFVRRFTIGLKLKRQRLTFLAPLAPWEPGHNAKFIRAVCHLTHRLRRALPGLKFGDVFNGGMYALSEIGHYAVSLFDELNDSSNLPIRTIVASAAPADFRNQWRGDVFAWFKTSPRTDAATWQRRSKHSRSSLSDSRRQRVGKQCHLFRSLNE